MTLRVSQKAIIPPATSAITAITMLVISFSLVLLARSVFASRTASFFTLIKSRISDLNCRLMGVSSFLSAAAAASLSVLAKPTMCCWILAGGAGGGPGGAGGGGGGGAAGAGSG